MKIELAAAVPWVLSILALLWNLFNSLWTTRLQKRIRKSNIEIDEFRSNIRAPIEVTLTKLDSVERSIRAASSSSLAVEELKNEIVHLNGNFVELLEDLYVCLSKANESNFANGDDWHWEAESLADECLGAFNVALDTNADQGSVAYALELAADKVHEIVAGIRFRIEEEIARHLN